eukprot:2242605-Prymnesium_polylepis.1
MYNWKRATAMPLARCFCDDWCSIRRIGRQTTKRLAAFPSSGNAGRHPRGEDHSDHWPARVMTTRVMINQGLLGVDGNVHANAHVR